MDELYNISVENVPGMNARAVFSCNTCDAVFREQEDIMPVQLIEGVEYMPWGAANDMPYRLLRLIEEDETMTTCLQFVSELCYGSGLKYETGECSQEIHDEIKDFFMDNAIPSYFMGVSQDLKHFAFAVSVIILSEDGSKIVNLCRKHACYCRFSPVGKSGRIEKVIYGNWRINSMNAEDYEVIDMLDPSSPWRDLAVRMGRMPGEDGIAKVRTSCRKFAILSKIPTADSTYYPIPFYASLFKSRWYDIKQLIATAKKAKIQNSAPIKYHVEISSKYFERLCREEGITAQDKRRERIELEKKNILEFLTAAENSGKVIFSNFFVTPDGKEQKEVVISKVDTNKEGGDWESDIQEAVNMMCFALRVHSNLVGSVPGKAQTNNSGSDKRELYTIAQALQKPYRDILFHVHRIIIRYNGWKGAKPECPFIMLTTLDEGKDAKEVKAK